MTDNGDNTISYIDDDGFVEWVKSTHQTLRLMDEGDDVMERLYGEYLAHLEEDPHRYADAPPREPSQLSLDRERGAAARRLWTWIDEAYDSSGPTFLDRAVELMDEVELFYTSYPPGARGDLT